MRILLPSLSFSEKEDYNSEMFNWGLLYIADYINRNGHEAYILVARFLDELKEKIRDKINSFDILGFSLMTPSMSDFLDIIVFIKSELGKKDIPIIAGGMHPTLIPEQTIRHPYVDFVIRGEGEIDLLKLMNRLEGGRNYDDIEGLCFKNPDGTYKIGSIQTIDDFFGLHPGVINYDLMDKEYLKSYRNNAAVFSGRGCPFRCLFCPNTVLRKKFSLKPAEVVLEEIDYLVRHFNPKYITFIDDIFFANKERLVEIIDAIIARKYTFKWKSTCRVNYFNKKNMDEDLLIKLQASGCQLLVFGVETGSQRVSDFIRKDIKIDKVYETAELLSRTKINGRFNFMIGFPEETSDEMKETFKMTKRLKAYGRNIIISGPQLFRVYPGGRLYDICMEHGYIEPGTLEEWAEVPRYMQRHTLIQGAPYPWFNHEQKTMVQYSMFIVLGGVSEKIKSKKQVWKLIYMIPCKLRINALSFKFPIDLFILRQLTRFYFFCKDMRSRMKN